MEEEYITLLDSGEISTEESENLRVKYKARQWENKRIYDEVRAIPLGQGRWFEVESEERAKQLQANALQTINRQCRRTGRGWYISALREGKRLNIIKRPQWERRMGILPVTILDREDYNKVMGMLGKPETKEKHGAIIEKQGDQNGD